MAEVAGTGRRARTEAQKQDRRRSILDAADAHLLEVGFEAFSMARVGALAGVAKGTLYLYFKTREEILLALYCRKLSAWETLLDASVEAGIDDQQFAIQFFDAVYAIEGLVALMLRLEIVIEHNVSLERLIESKRDMAALLERLAAALAPRLRLSTAQTFDALGSLGSLLLGAAQLDTGPEFDAAELPADVLAFMDAFASRDLFVTNAGRILAGIRAEA